MAPYQTPPHCQVLPILKKKKPPEEASHNSFSFALSKEVLGQIP